ncbi:hypothetical protein [Nonomuraea aurantiaca]|uniref:hypothetical protein n=1 Tax=Nonomuraea aurantiaca TaxID=2878562 RepID=UPI001CD9E4CA|nr:hypothetical protein [Nonomuraea aurantiaca]MCA2229924.1 hypothetical protein [Nonomuraea aurantiaca]
MSVFLGMTHAENDSLSETYFARAAGALDVHRAGSEHACLSCAAAWPCAPALAAAFMLDLHTA